MVAAWPFYFVGTFVIFAGFVALGRWVKGIAGAPSDPPGHVLGVAAVAFLLGTSSVAVAIVFDSDQIRLESTRTFVYRVSVELNGADTVRLLLPAPLDTRFVPRLNATNGTATLRLVSDVGGLALELTAHRNVSFEIRVGIVDVPFNRTMTRFVPSTPPEQSGTAAATIDLTSIGGGGADVRLALRIEFNEFCFSTRHALDASIVPGASSYPVASTVTTC